MMWRTPLSRRRGRERSRVWVVFPLPRGSLDGVTEAWCCWHAGMQATRRQRTLPKSSRQPPEAFSIAPPGTSACRISPQSAPIQSYLTRQMMVIPHPTMMVAMRMTSPNASALPPPIFILTDCRVSPSTRRPCFLRVFLPRHAPKRGTEADVFVLSRRRDEVTAGTRVARTSSQKSWFQGQGSAMIIGTSKYVWKFGCPCAPTLPFCQSPGHQSVQRPPALFSGFGVPGLGGPKARPCKQHGAQTNGEAA